MLEIQTYCTQCGDELESYMADGCAMVEPCRCCKAEKNPLKLHRSSGLLRKLKPTEQHSPTTLLPLAEAKAKFVYDYIKSAIERNNGNRTRAAAELKVDVRTVFRALEQKE